MPDPVPALRCTWRSPVLRPGAANPFKFYEAQKSGTKCSRHKGTALILWYPTRLGIREGDTITILEGLSPIRGQRIRGLIRVRDAVRRSLRSQLEATDEGNVEMARRQLNAAFDAVTDLLNTTPPGAPVRCEWCAAAVWETTRAGMRSSNR